MKSANPFMDGQPEHVRKHLRKILDGRALSPERAELATLAFDAKVEDDASAAA